MVTADNTARLSELFDAHEERLYRLARRLAPTVDDALDLVQETFLRAARAPGSIPHGVSDEEAWLVRVLVNVRHDQWRRERQSEFLTASIDPEGHGGAKPGPWRAREGAQQSLQSRASPG